MRCLPIIQQWNTLLITSQRKEGRFRQFIVLSRRWIINLCSKTKWQAERFIRCNWMNHQHQGAHVLWQGLSAPEIIRRGESSRRAHSQILIRPLIVHKRNPNRYYLLRPTHLGTNFPVGYTSTIALTVRCGQGATVLILQRPVIRDT